MDIHKRGYAQPDMLVSTQWVEDHLNDADVRFIESDEDTLLYFSGHIPHAVNVDWVADLNDPVRRDYIEKEGFEELMSRLGMTKDTLAIFYGDQNNWWACYAFWVFQLFGHSKAKIMDGGRLKWEKEGRPMSKDQTDFPRSAYTANNRDDGKIRVFREQVLQHVQQKKSLIDVRSPEEFSGERLHMANYPNEGALRGGHIPGAKNVPWSRAIDTDTGEFKPADELQKIYMHYLNIQPQDEIITYCRIGERSSHTWFVLTYLLGFENVRNYDGSWTEYGNLVNVPIER
ncbi:MAG: sulfurtransferase [Caldithrix sp.]|nr:sulfurtransferase [Caldithrix sp.]